jgi:hypothetical protein
MYLINFKMKFKSSIITLFFIIFCSLILSCKKDDVLQNPKPAVEVTTLILDSLSSPLLVGGNLKSNSGDAIIEKGVIFGTSDNLTIENSKAATIFFWAPLPTPSNYVLKPDLNSGGWATPSAQIGIVKSTAGIGNFNIKLMGLVGSTRYFVRAYAKTPKAVFYGKALRVTTPNFKRDASKSLDVSNVFWKSQFTLFDLLTDEIILPDSNGNYSFWYSSNENINVFSDTKSIAQLQGFLFYKFKTRANCQRWCDLRSGRVTP